MESRLTASGGGGEELSKKKKGLMDLSSINFNFTYEPDFLKTKTVTYFMSISFFLSFCFLLNPFIILLSPTIPPPL